MNAINLAHHHATVIRGESDISEKSDVKRSMHSDYHLIHGFEAMEGPIDQVQ